LYDTPSTFLNNFSAQLPVFIISKYHGIEVLGIYILANRLIDVPVQLILRSVSQVYLPSINDAYLIGRDKVMEFFKMTFKKLTILTIIIMVPAFLLSPYVNLFFGDKWVGVSLFLQIILIYKSFQLINSPLSITLTVMKKQEVSLILTIISIVVRLVSMYIFRENVISMIIAFSISTSAFHVAYLIVVYFHINKISHNSPLG
jgi:O-antigen/teichoic acid export membrane protein